MKTSPEGNFQYFHVQPSVTWSETLKLHIQSEKYVYSQKYDCGKKNFFSKFFFWSNLV